MTINVVFGPSYPQIVLCLISTCITFIHLFYPMTDIWQDIRFAKKTHRFLNNILCIPQKSSIDAISVIVNKMQKTLDDKKFGILIFLDISKAFDSACFDIILSKLRRLKTFHPIFSHSSSAFSIIVMSFFAHSRLCGIGTISSWLSSGR